MNRILSGIRPTGMLHLGNYFGAIAQFLHFQNENCERYFFVADLHALTTHVEPTAVYQSTLAVTRGYLACGLDPERSNIYKQSSIQRIPYLSLLLSMFTSESWLRKCTTFKEKSEQQSVISLGLLAYPVLMASDILIMQGNFVPVGHDQLQHLEMTRDIATKFNFHFGGKFVLPDAIKMEAIRVPGLDGKGKMGKSDNNFIGLFEEPKTIEKKIMAAITDSNEHPDSSMSQPLQNLFHLVKLVCSQETFAKYQEMFQRGERKFYGELKKELAKQTIEFLTPFRQKFYSNEASEDRAKEVLHNGSKQANAIAESTFQMAYDCFQLDFPKSV